MFTRTPLLLSLGCLLCLGQIQARKIKLIYEGGAKNIIHHNGLYLDAVVDIELTSDFYLPDKKVWTFDLLADGQTHKCEIDGWGGTSVDITEVNFKDGADFMNMCDRGGQPFTVSCDPPATPCKEGLPPISI